MIDRGTLLRTPCFGVSFDARAEECSTCTAPIVLADGRVYHAREACRTLVERRKPTAALATRPSAQDVREMLARGLDVDAMLEEITGPDPDEAATRAARRLLGSRLAYLRRSGAPDVPTLG